jgi:hypothetical protein
MAVVVLVNLPPNDCIAAAQAGQIVRVVARARGIRPASCAAESAASSPDERSEIRDIMPAW